MHYYFEQIGDWVTALLVAAFLAMAAAALVA